MKTMLTYFKIVEWSEICLTNNQSSVKKLGKLQVSRSMLHPLSEELGSKPGEISILQRGLDSSII